MTDGETYAGPLAMSQAKGRGWNFSLANWRDIFLAIVDTIATDGARSSNETINARWVGPLREGAERWRIRAPFGDFDCVYYPDKALLQQIIRPRDEQVAA